MGSIVVVVVLPFAKFVVEDVGVVDHDTVEESIELFLVYAVAAFDFAVEAWCGGFDVGVAESLVLDVPVELGLELGSVVGLDCVDAKWKAFGDVVDERDRGLLVAAWIDPQDS